ncbi:DUF423 domain-containing protein [Motilimonas pumila]|uniref:DUF423 domain-containing protein n=1 Tax=Motilimonas pumila TaxID=2303987 RepID=A0A418YJQ2_9GAMM|nr:DUF423 domain-containing protein [Motilimonas pumila]RJG51211.1 DUF423 domain-containing protein [Motilimonas pumila]
MRISQTLLALAGLLGAFAVAFSAYASHSLMSSLPTALQQHIQLAVNYHLVHALLMVIASITALLHLDLWAQRFANLAATCCAAGILMFSGSFYIWALSGEKLLAKLTPVGGTSFILAWLFIALMALRGLKR